MIDLEENHSQFLPLEDEQKQAIYHTVRRKRLGRLDPAFRLRRTHSYAPGTTGIDMAAFPDRLRPITIITELVTTSTNPTGIICEFGGSGIGFLFGLAAGQSLEFGAGSAAPASPQGAVGAVVVPALAVAGVGFHFAIAVDPGTGRVRVYHDGKIILRVDTSTGMTSGWAGGDAGSVGAAPSGGFNPSTPSAVSGAPSGFELVAPLQMYNGQLPRNF